MKVLYFTLIISIMIITSAVAQLPVDPDLVMWVGEGSANATTAKDATGNGNDGTLKDGAKWVPGKFGSGVRLEGKAFMEIPGRVLTEKGTVLFWFKPNWDGSDGADYRIFDASLGGIYFFIAKGANHADINPEDFGFYFEDAADADWQDIEFNPDGIIKKDQWFHVAATWEFGGGNAFLYIDGEELATSPNQTGGFPALHNLPRFGTESIIYVPITNGAEGVIDEIGIFSRALDQNEIGNMMEVGLSVEPENKLTTTWGNVKVPY